MIFNHQTWPAEKCQKSVLWKVPPSCHRSPSQRLEGLQIRRFYSVVWSMEMLIAFFEAPCRAGWWKLSKELSFKKSTFLLRHSNATKICCRPQPNLDKIPMTLKRNDQSWSKEKNLRVLDSICHGILLLVQFACLQNHLVFLLLQFQQKLLFALELRLHSKWIHFRRIADLKRPVENSADSKLSTNKKSSYALPSVEKIISPCDSHLAFTACFSFSHFFLSFSKEVIRRWALANWFLNVTFSITGHTAWWVALSLKGPRQPQPDSKYLQRTLRLVGLCHHSSNDVENPNPAPSVLIFKETHAQAMQSHWSSWMFMLHLVFCTGIAVKLHALIVSYLLELPSED